MEELDYTLMPKAAWELLRGWYGLSQGSKPIERLQFPLLSSVPHLLLPSIGMLLSMVPM